MKLSAICQHFCRWYDLASQAQAPPRSQCHSRQDAVQHSVRPNDSVERAQAVIAAGIAEAKKRGWEMNIAVVDQHGDLKAFGRMDEAQLASISIAEHKARTAARYRRETRLFEDAVMKGVAYIPTLDDVIASRGGIPLVDDGKLIGAVGCSGGTGSQDEATCKVAAALINK